MLLSTLLVGLVSTAFIEIYPEGLLFIFGGNEDELYMQYGRLVFRLFLSTVALTCYMKMSSIFFQSCGQPAKATITSVLRDIVLFSPLVIILPLIAENNESGSGIVALLYAPMIADVIATCIIVIITIRLFKKL